MKLTNKDMVMQCLERIEMVQMHQKAIDSARWFVSHRSPGERLDDGLGLRARLWEIEANEWRSLFMWGLTLDDAERDRIRAAAYDRFLGDSASVGHWLSPSGVTQSGWMAADEDEFREMARKAFAPKGKP